MHLRAPRTDPLPGPEVGLWAYPWGLADEGWDRSLSRIAGLGVATLRVAASCHSVQGSFPHNPKRPVLRADGRYDEAQRLLRRYGAYDVESRGAGPTAPRAAEGERAVQLREEELVARKRPVEAGEAQVRKEVVTEQRTVQVPVAREELVVERRPVERRPAEQPVGEAADVIEVPLREEQVQVEKRPVVYEEVEVGKRQVQETQRVSDTVRREEARIDQEGDVEVRGTDETRRP